MLPNPATPYCVVASSFMVMVAVSAGDVDIKLPCICIVSYIGAECERWCCCSVVAGGALDVAVDDAVADVTDDDTASAMTLFIIWLDGDDSLSCASLIAGAMIAAASLSFIFICCKL